MDAERFEQPALHPAPRVSAIARTAMPDPAHMA
jgi:hypothetical protein